MTAKDGDDSGSNTADAVISKEWRWASKRECSFSFGLLYIGTTLEGVADYSRGKFSLLNQSSNNHPHKHAQKDFLHSF